MSNYTEERWTGNALSKVASASTTPRAIAVCTTCVRRKVKTLAALTLSGAKLQTMVYAPWTDASAGITRRGTAPGTWPGWSGPRMLRAAHASTTRRARLMGVTDRMRPRGSAVLIGRSSAGGQSCLRSRSIGPQGLALLTAVGTSGASETGSPFPSIGWSWQGFLAGVFTHTKTSITSTETGLTTDRKTWSCGRRSNLAVSALLTRSHGPRKFLPCTASLSRR